MNEKLGTQLEISRQSLDVNPDPSDGNSYTCNHCSVLLSWIVDGRPLLSASLVSALSLAVWV